MRFQAAILFVFAAGCAADGDHSAPHLKLPANAGLRPIAYVPASGGLGYLFDSGTGFAFTGPTAVGGATFTHANVADPESAPNGTGTLDLTVGGTHYTSSTVATGLVTGITDDDGNPYIALVAAGESDDGGTQNLEELFVIMKQSDFAIGTPIALDGSDRIAIFEFGPATSEQPTVYAAAITGSVTLTAGSLTPGATVDATMTGDFGPIAIDGGGGGGGGGGSGSGSAVTSMIVPGTYTLAYAGPSEVDCFGALVGHEADFSGIALADLGLVGGSVAVTTPSTTAVDVDGSVIASTFDGTPFELDAYDGDPGVFAGVTNDTGTGPDGTVFVGKYLAVDGSSATSTFINAAAGGGYSSTDGSSGCTVSFGASLTQ